MKKFLLLFMLLFVMTAQELQWGEMFLGYYSGQVPNLPRDNKKIEAYVYGTEEEKRIILKQFLSEVIKPMEQVNKLQVEKAVTDATDRITAIDDYVK